jgi:hypothetical protein
VLNFPEGVSKEAPWRGKIFNVRGILQLSNTVFALPDTSRYDARTFEHLSVQGSGLANVQNVISRGPEFQFSTKEKGRVRASMIGHQEISEEFPYNPPR